ncbi:MAG: hypothetical protein Q4D88_06510 [Anaerococcus sp.]|nr:hypothetical protein [Anaerococcus sp.]
MKEDIIAILPEYIEKFGIGSRIYKERSSLLDKRSPRHVLKNLYDKKGKDKKLVDKRIEEKLQLKRNFPYIIDENHVFFSIKVRDSLYDRQTRAFVNVKYVRKVEDSRIILMTGEVIESLNQEKSIKANRNIAMIFYYEQMIKTLANTYEAINFIKENFA